MNCPIRRATPDGAAAVAATVKALTGEIIERTRARYFSVDLPQTAARCWNSTMRWIFMKKTALKSPAGAK